MGFTLVDVFSNHAPGAIHKCGTFRLMCSLAVALELARNGGNQGFILSLSVQCSTLNYGPAELIYFITVLLVHPQALAA